MTLQEEIDLNSKKISSDSYPMSIGEVISLYKEKEIDIHPEFQRVFRWNIEQQSKLIESILLGIPMPSIFVSQREDGVWDVIDGTQRLSTILKFVGVLINDEGDTEDPSSLVSTKYLTKLEGMYWEHEDEKRSLSQTQRMYIKRYKVDFKIVKKESSPEVKYELFQRVNTLGTRLSDQEIRNCLLVMANKEFFYWLKALRDDANFQNVIFISERYSDEQYDLELVLRLLVFSTKTNFPEKWDFAEFLTSSMLELIKVDLAERQVFELKFRKIFSILNTAMGENSFRRYDFDSDRSLGPFLVSAFEVITLGLYEHIDHYNNTEGDATELKSRIQRIWGIADFKMNSGMGVRASTRIPKMKALGIEHFKK